MSHLIFILALAFVAWQWSRRLRPDKNVPPDARRSTLPIPRAVEDDQAEDIAADVAGLVSGLFGGKAESLVGEVVGRALQESGIAAELSRRAAEAMAPVKQAIPSRKAPPQARDRQRAKYLLDGDGGYRQRTDRTARLQQSFRGKGLCSPR
ncbi:MAG: hypothetical protein AB1440_24245 [Pseudomonadota bacterium]